MLRLIPDIALQRLVRWLTREDHRRKALKFADRSQREYLEIGGGINM